MIQTSFFEAYEPSSVTFSEDANVIFEFTPLKNCTVTHKTVGLQHPAV